MKATAKANSNTAMIKYWGKHDEELIIPMNNSISLTIDALTTTTTVEFSKNYTEDIFSLNGQEQMGKAKDRVTKHLDLIRKLASVKLKAKVVSRNNFPTAAGLASSASGFAALTVAACKALDLKKTAKELSIISRQGSGSSARSIFGGYVEWQKGSTSEESHAIQLAGKDWFDIRDIVVIFKKFDRKLSTREAMKISKETSPFYGTRLKTTEENLLKVRKAIKERDFTLLGKTAEKDCLSMHAVAMTSYPSQIFWTGETLGIMRFVEEIREGGMEAYYTIDTGSNMHILTLPKFVDEITAVLRKFYYVDQVIVAKPGDGPEIIDKHLF